MNVRNNEGATPLHFAAQGGHLDAVSMLLESDPRSPPQPTPAPAPEPAYPLEWQGRVDNLCTQFPAVGKTAVVAALHAHGGHAGMANGELRGSPAGKRNDDSTKRCLSR